VLCVSVPLSGPAGADVSVPMPVPMLMPVPVPISVFFNIVLLTVARYSRNAADMAEKAANKADGLALDDDGMVMVR